MQSVVSSGKKIFFVYISLSLLCVLFMISSENKAIRFLKDVENTIFYPFRLIVRGIQQELVAIKNVFSSNKDAKKIELDQLKMELESYKKQLNSLNASQEENIRLKSLLNLRQNLEYDSIVATVIGRDFTYGYSYVTLNKGRLDGVVDNLPVVSFFDGVKSVVGIVSESTLLTSKVRTLKSEIFSLGVYLPRTNVHAVVEGLGGSSKEIQLLYIDKDIPIKQNDFIYTSAESSLLPPNFLVGIINNIDNTKKTSISYQVYVLPSVRFEKLSEVFILKPRKDK